MVEQDQKKNEERTEVNKYRERKHTRKSKVPEAVNISLAEPMMKPLENKQKALVGTEKGRIRI